MGEADRNKEQHHYDAASVVIDQLKRIESLIAKAQSARAQGAVRVGDERAVELSPQASTAALKVHKAELEDQLTTHRKSIAALLTQGDKT